MALILNLETSTDICSTALLERDQLLAEAVIDRPRIHAEQLTSLMQQVVENGGARFADLDAVAVSAGPGSYTGLRIGVSAAKGITFAYDIPLLAVPSLEVLAAEAAVCARDGDQICVVRSARKDEIYCSVFRFTLDNSHSMHIRCTVPPQVIELEQLPTLIEVDQTNDLWITGEARDRTADALHGAARTFPSEHPSPTAYWVGRSAVHRYANEEFVDTASFEPQYVRPFHTHRRKPIFDRLSGNP